MNRTRSSGVRMALLGGETLEDASEDEGDAEDGEPLTLYLPNFVAIELRLRSVFPTVRRPS